MHIPVIHEFIDQTTKKKHYTRTKPYCNEPLMFEKLSQSTNLRLSFSLRGISVILCPYSIWQHVEASYYTSWHKLVSTDIFFFYHGASYYNTLVVIILFIFRQTVRFLNEYFAWRSVILFFFWHLPMTVPSKEQSRHWLTVEAYPQMGNFFFFGGWEFIIL